MLVTNNLTGETIEAPDPIEEIQPVETPVEIAPVLTLEELTEKVLILENIVGVV